MSLQTDIIFVKALRSNSRLLNMLPAGDVYNTSIALPDEQVDNAPLPYVIVSYDGLNNQDTTKDTSYGGSTDVVTIGVEIVAETRPQLASIAIMIRKTIQAYFAAHVLTTRDEDYDLIPISYLLQAQAVQYDALKPCYWQRLQFVCDTTPDDYDEEENDDKDSTGHNE